MATEIKIYIADGQDQNARIDLSPEQAAAVRHFLAKVTYGDIYRHVPSTGDGNARSSKSDWETCVARQGLAALRHAFDSAFSRTG